MSLPVFNPEPEPKDRATAYEESASLFADNEARRQDSILGAIHVGGLIVFWTFVGVGTVLFAVWAWHMGAPEKWRFLTPEQRNELQAVLLAGVGSSFVTEASRRWLHETKPTPKSSKKRVG